MTRETLRSLGTTNNETPGHQQEHPQEHQQQHQQYQQHKEQEPSIPIVDESTAGAGMNSCCYCLCHHFVEPRLLAAKQMDVLEASCAESVALLVAAAWALVLVFTASPERSTGSDVVVGTAEEEAVVAPWQRVGIILSATTTAPTTTTTTITTTTSRSAGAQALRRLAVRIVSDFIEWSAYSGKLPPLLARCGETTNRGKRMRARNDRRYCPLSRVVAQQEDDDARVSLSTSMIPTTTQTAKASGSKTTKRFIATVWEKLARWVR